MKYLPFLVFLMGLSLPVVLSAQDATTTTDSIPKRQYFTKQLIGTPPEIDGDLSDLCWDAVPWSGDYIQLQPHEGHDPTQETVFKILYDAKNLYVAFRCFDKEPEKIVRRMSRRDGFEGDWVEINIDSYNDKRTAFSFTISVSGVKGDEFVSDDGNNWDPSWNPIWYADTKVDTLGWTAEVRIPLSQIRYGNNDNHVWGIQSTRRDFREESRSVWQPIRQNAGRWVSGFGELHGINGIKPQRQIEVQPYVLGKVETFEKEEGNPFATGSDSDINVGLDGKFGVTSDLTLDFTINPDFGQVEADPGALNLDGFQIFFPEQRPFFIENRNLFDYQFSSAITGGNFTIDNLFYSRRIGRSPHYYPDLADSEYADVPNQTSILGAAKFSGKTKSGLGIGILESVTAKEEAVIQLDGEERKEVVEPLSNYFVGRLTQDFRDGQTVLGGIFTATNRFLEDTGIDDLHKSAYTGGVDILHRWKDRTYYIAASGIFSRVNGSQEAILQTQTAFEHYFQRPDADHLRVDSTATSLLGHGGTIKVGKGAGNWNFEGGVTWRSPELELNDIGFMLNADEINHFFWTGYRFNKPFSIFRNASVNYNHWLRWDFGGTNTYQATNLNWHAMFNNFWQTGMGFTYEFKDISNYSLFGGPALRRSRGFAPWIFISTDRRKMVRFDLNAFTASGFEKNAPKTVFAQSFNLGITIQPTNAFNFSIRPAYNQNKRKVQFVTDLEYEGQTRYIAGQVDQQTLSVTVRFNVNITPNLTLQYYGQPFISRGRYHDFKYITDPKAEEFYDRFHLYTAEEIGYDAENDEYLIDETGDKVTDYSFGKPDFNYMQYRSNLVARWEYIPGSEIFLVWSQGITNSGNPEEALFSSLTDNLFDQQPHNIFLVKATYRFLR